MKSYREAHIGKNVGEIYDSMHSVRVDSLIWREFVRPFVRRIMEESAQAGHSSYLDFACGTGRVLKVGYSVFHMGVGVDISPDMLSVAANRVPEATLHCVDVTCTPTAVQGKFDCVTMFRFLLNAEPDLRLAALKWVASRMEPGSILIVNNHRNSLSAHGLMARAFRHSAQRETNTLSRRATVSLLGEAGFEVTREEGFRILPTLSGKPIFGGKLQMAMERLCRRLGLGRLGAELVFVAARR